METSVFIELPPNFILPFGGGGVASGEIGVEDIDREVIRKSTITKKLLRKDTE